MEGQSSSREQIEESACRAQLSDIMQKFENGYEGRRREGRKSKEERGEKRRELKKKRSEKKKKQSVNLYRFEE